MSNYQNNQESEVISGVVSDTSSRDFGDATLYSFQIEGDRRYFRLGEDAPTFGKGQHITFTSRKKGKNSNVWLSSVTISDGVPAAAPTPAAAAPAAPAAAGAPSGGGYKGYNNKSEFFDAKDRYWDEKEKYQKEVVDPRISFSASQKDAVALVTAALDNEALSFGGVSVGKKLDMLLEFVDQVTVRFYNQRTDVPSAVAAIEGGE